MDPFKDTRTRKQEFKQFFRECAGATRVCVATTSRGHDLCEANYLPTTGCGRDTQKLSTHTHYPPMFSVSADSKGLKFPVGLFRMSTYEMSWKVRSADSKGLSFSASPV